MARSSLRFAAVSAAFALIVATVVIALSRRQGVRGLAAELETQSMLAAASELVPQPMSARVLATLDDANTESDTRSAVESESEAARAKGIDVRGRVLDQHGQPIEVFGIRTEQRDANNFFVAKHTFAAETHPNGEFDLLGLAPQIWVVEPFAEGYVLKQPLRFWKSNERRMDFVLVGNGAVEGTVLDLHNQPIEGATVTFTDGWLRNNKDLGKTDRNGRFRVESELAKVTLFVTHPQFQRSSDKKVDVIPLRTTRGVDFRLQRGLELTVSFANAEFGESAEVIVHGWKASFFETAKTARARGGVAKVSGLYPGLNEVTVTLRDNDVESNYVALVELENGPTAERARSPDDIDPRELAASGGAKANHIEFELPKGPRVEVTLELPSDNEPTREFSSLHSLPPRLVWMSSTDVHPLELLLASGDLSTYESKYSREAVRDAVQAGKIDPTANYEPGGRIHFTVPAPGTYALVWGGLIRFEVPNAEPFTLELPSSH